MAQILHNDQIYENAVYESDANKIVLSSDNHYENTNHSTTDNIIDHFSFNLVDFYLKLESAPHSCKYSSVHSIRNE